MLHMPDLTTAINLLFWLVVSGALYFCFWLQKRAPWFKRIRPLPLNWPSLAALLLALLVLALPISWPLQGTIFTLLTLFSWGVGRRIYAPLQLHIASRPTRQYPVGKVLPLLSKSQLGWGKIRVGNTLWKVRFDSQEIEADKGALVRVVAREKQLLVVEPVSLSTTAAESHTQTSQSVTAHPRNAPEKTP